MRFTFTDRAAPFCHIGFNESRVEGGNAAWSTTPWGDPLAEWAGWALSWEDVSCDVFEFQCEYGRAALQDRFVAGSGTLLVRNVSGWADPEQLQPGRSIRVGVDHEEFGRRIVFRGFIDEVIPTYVPGFTDSVEVVCCDALGEVNRIKLAPAELPYGAGDLAHDRIHSVLDRARWPITQRKIDVTSWGLIADEQGGQVADLLSQIADSVGGSLWGDHDANIVFRQQDWQTFTPTTPLDAIIGNVGPNDVCPGQWQRPFDRASISTQVRMGRDAETAQIVNDLEGQAKFGIEPFDRTDLLTQSDANLLTLAERTLETRSWRTAPRVRAVHLDARHGDAQLDVLSRVDVYKPSHFRCRLQEPNRLVFDARYIATGVSHTITAHAWELDMNLDRAAPYFVPVATLWDAALWDQTVFSVRGTPEAALAEARTYLSRIGR